MRKLTDEELREPDMTLIIPLDVWLILPDEVKKTLSHWINHGDISQVSNRVFVLPAYRARELETITKIALSKRIL